MKLPILFIAVLALTSTNFDIAYGGTRPDKSVLFGIVGTFQPLSCNEGIDSVDCTKIGSKANSLKTLVENASGEEVIVPCGECAIWDLPLEVTEISGGLNVLGKLYVPSSASGTIRAPHIYVQGVLQIDPPKPTSTVKFVLYGTASKIFVPHQENADGCGGSSGCDVGKKPFVVAGGRLDINGIADPENCLSWVKLQDVIPNPNNGGIDQIIVGSDAASCWNAGEELLLTSPDMHYEWRETKTIHSVEAVSGSIVLTEPIHEAFAEATVVANADRPYFAVEVASLSRRIVLEAEDDDDTNNGLMGGHFIVLRTPEVAQKIEGVLIRNFGQQGNLGRYPVHFHLCGDVSGSIISKNVIRNSNQRCVVIHGTDNAHIYDNIAFETHGHCFFTEDGIETGNIFERNLGADVRTPTFVISGENDNEPSVFWITNPNNTWIENVAAGSDASGFWFDTKPHVRGPSRVGNEKYHPKSVDVAIFRDNTVHSINRRGIMLYSPGWTPKVENVLENNLVYKVRWEGWFIHGNTNIAIKGGVVSDCGKGLFNFRSSNMKLQDIEVIGYSEHFRRVRAKTKTWWYCPGEKNHITGMTIHPWRNFANIASMGTTAHNVTFSRFGLAETGCEGSRLAAISMSIDQVVDFYDTPNRFSGLTFEGNMRRLEVCAADKKGIHNMNIEDVDGSLGPTGNPGFFVSDYDSMTTFAADLSKDENGTGCVSVADTCNLAFCDKSCLRQVTLRTNNAFSTQGIEMVISSLQGSNITTTGAWYHYSYSGKASEHTDHKHDGKYGATLPSYGNFTISFRDSVTGLPAWPDYVEVEYEANPLCYNDEHNIGSVALVKPVPTEDRCRNLVKNGDFEGGKFDAWQQSHAALGLISPGAGNSSYALQVSNLRRRSGFLVSQWIDVSCLVANSTYVFTAEVRLLESGSSRGSNHVPPCNHNEGDCPKAYIYFYYWDAASKKRTKTVRMLGITSAVLNIRFNSSLDDMEDSDLWYQVEGTTEFSMEDVNASRVQIQISSPEGREFVIDNVDMKMKGDFPMLDDINSSNAAEEFSSLDGSELVIESAEMKLDVLFPTLDNEQSSNAAKSERWMVVFFTISFTIHTLIRC